jgi:hypothetical protein
MNELLLLLLLGPNNSSVLEGLNRSGVCLDKQLINI